MASVCLIMLTCSPVSIDWSTLRVVESILMSLISAGILSPTEGEGRGREGEGRGGYSR